jgi:hypothetical protein
MITEEQRRAWRAARPPVTQRPKHDAQRTAVVSVPVSDGFAEKVRHDPRSLRLWVRGQDGAAAVERPKANPQHVTVRVDLVQEVDAAGRPIWDSGGAVSNYDPIKRFEEGVGA